MGLLKTICEKENIKLIGFTKELSKMFSETDNFAGEGRAVVQTDQKYILFDPNSSLWEKRFTVSHEIAHHLFGHLRPNTTLSPESREMEANIFASVLTAFLLLEEYIKSEDM